MSSDPALPDTAPRVQKIIAVGFSLAACWYAMLAVHEFGHVIGAFATGAELLRVELPLAGFSRTAIQQNSHPGWVVWLGPLTGTTLPLIAWLVLRSLAVRWWAGYFAGFCLVANGAYLGLGWIDRVGDTADILRSGGQVWHMIVFGVIATVTGLWVWHHLGDGLGVKGMSRREALWAIALSVTYTLAVVLYNLL